MTTVLIAALVALGLGVGVSRPARAMTRGARGPVPQSETASKTFLARREGPPALSARPSARPAGGGPYTAGMARWIAPDQDGNCLFQIPRLC